MLREEYKNKISQKLKKELNMDNVLEVPKIEKVVLNIGAGQAVENAKVIDSAVRTLETIAGQKPVVTKSKKAISNFKLKEKQPIGVSVTLRGRKMWEFLDRLIFVVLPRERDFRGINPNKFDGKGNFNFGLKEQIIFPEIDYDKIDFILGMNISIVTTAKNDKEAKVLLDTMGFPFRK